MYKQVGNPQDPNISLSLAPPLFSNDSDGQILDHINLRDLFPELDFVDALRKSSTSVAPGISRPAQVPPNAESTAAVHIDKKASDNSGSGGSSGGKSLEATSQGGDTSSFGEVGQAELVQNLSNGEFDDLATSMANNLKVNKDYRSEGEFSDLAGFNIQEDGVGIGISVASLRKEDLLGKKRTVGIEF